MCKLDILREYGMQVHVSNVRFIFDQSETLAKILFGMF